MKQDKKTLEKLQYEHICKEKKLKRKRKVMLKDRKIFFEKKYLENFSFLL